MARPKGSKNKSVAEKVEAIVEEVAALMPKAPEMEAEILEAITEIRDIAKAPEEVKAPTGKFVGVHPVTKEPVYI